MPTYNRQASLRLRYRSSGWREVLPSVRGLATIILVVSLVVGAWRWITQPAGVVALQFTPHTIGSMPGLRGVLIKDVDGDEQTDIVTASQYGVKVWRQTEAWKFEWTLVTDKDSERVYADDLDEDGDVDLLITYASSTTGAEWFENLGEMEFTDHPLTGCGKQAVAAIGDIDGDGSKDMVTAGSSGDKRILIRWINDGSGSFTKTQLSADSGVKAVAIGDLDDDGYNDIVTGGSQGLQRWDTEDGYSWTRKDIQDDQEDQISLDIAKDESQEDVVIGGVDGSAVKLFRSNQYNTQTISEDVDGKTVVLVDMNNDTYLDAVVAAQDDNEVYWYRNTGDGEYERETLAAGLQSVYGVAVGDIDGDDDLDFVTGDLYEGDIQVYERTRTEPVAEKPSSIQQSTNGSGLVTFDVKVSDEDYDETRLRVQYSTDGVSWDKPWITKISTDNGEADIINRNGFQVGTSDGIDTDTNDDVTVTFTWDTKSILNTGGALTGEYTKVWLRALPRDDYSTGTHAVSDVFVVDNQAPTGVGGLKIVSFTNGSASMSWNKPADSSKYTYTIYYGTDSAAVLDKESDVWDGEDDERMDKTDTLDTVITGLKSNTAYTFKLYVTDIYGNETAASSVRGTSQTVTGSVTPTPTSTTATGTPTPTPKETTVQSATPAVEATPTSTPVPTSVKLPSTLEDNRAPVADAGTDQVVNPKALVVLDGSASYDPDVGDTGSLSYRWRQLSGSAVKLQSASTSQASLVAGSENDSYVFALTVSDTMGASATDTVTVAVRALATESTVPIAVGGETSPVPTQLPEPEETEPAFVRHVLKPADIVLFILSVLSTLVLVIERILRSWNSRTNRVPRAVLGGGRDSLQGKVIHYKTGEPIVGARIMIYDGEGKLRATEVTTDQGTFPTFFPAGQYTLGVKMTGFTFAPAAKAVVPENSIVYSGGKLTVQDPNQPLSIVIPMKPTAGEVSSMRVQVLHAWQSVQRWGRMLSWPLFLAGSLLNTALIFIVPSLSYLALEGLYIGLIIAKIALEVRMRPAYGLVRDAITHVSLDLAVVRLLEQKTNRLVMTRVTNSQGKFFALPPAGVYRVTVTKPGYASFSRDDVEIKSEHDTTLQMTADLMPIAPQTTRGLVGARAAVL